MLKGKSWFDYTNFSPNDYENDKIILKCFQ